MLPAIPAPPPALVQNYVPTWVDHVPCRDRFDRFNFLTRTGLQHLSNTKKGTHASTIRAVLGRPYCRLNDGSDVYVPSWDRTFVLVIKYDSRGGFMGLDYFFEGRAYA